MSKPKFDQSQYVGRLYAMLDLIDPRTLLVSDAALDEARGLLKQYEELGQKVPAGRSNEEMWEARKTVEAIIHPVTQEKMFLFGRMSCFVPMNVPICAIMLSANTPVTVFLSQWLNQTYNVMNNYVNRSAASVEWTPLLQSYALAVSISGGIALGARSVVQAVPVLAKLGIAIPYFAVISAGSCNVAFTRSDEWMGAGVPIFDKDGNKLGISLKAGQQAVFNTVSTRSCCLPIPVLLVPPVVMAVLPFTGLVAKAAEMAVIITCISFALPCALAILPQQMELEAAYLEPEYRNCKDAQGNPILTVFANKGL